MHRLVRKDLRISVRYLLLVLAFYLIHAPVNFKLSAGYLITNIAVTFLLATGVTFIDWRYDTDSFIGSLPLRRSTIVGGRYLTALVALAIGFPICFGYAALLDALMAPERATASALLSFEGGVAFVVLIAILVSVFFPLYFRLGMGRGWMAFGVVAAAGGAWLAGGSGLARPAASTAGGSAPRELLMPLERGLIDALAALRGQLGTALFVLVGLGAIGLLGLVSIRLSARFYARRDL